MHSRPVRDSQGRARREGDRGGGRSCESEGGDLRRFEVHAASKPPIHHHYLEAACGKEKRGGLFCDNDITSQTTR